MAKVMKKKESENTEKSSKVKSARPIGKMGLLEWAWRSSSKIFLVLGIIGLIILSVVLWIYVHWALVAGMGVGVGIWFGPAHKFVKIPHKLIMEFNRKLRHLQCYKVPNQKFRHFDIEDNVPKLSAGSNKMLWLASKVDFNNYTVECAWPDGATPLDFYIDDQTMFEIAEKYKALAEQDILSKTASYVRGHELAQRYSKKMDKYELDNMEEEKYGTIPDSRATEYHDKLREAKRRVENARQRQD